MKARPRLSFRAEGEKSLIRNINSEGDGRKGCFPIVPASGLGNDNQE
jgi:hypothetical protein